MSFPLKNQTKPKQKPPKPVLLEGTANSRGGAEEVKGQPETPCIARQ